MWGTVFLATVGLKGLQWLMENGESVFRPKRRTVEKVEVEVPITEAGTAVPLFFGTVRIRQPILAWYGDVKNTQVPPQLVAYRGSFLYILGIPCPNSLDVKLREMWIGERRVSAALTTGYFPVDESSQSFADEVSFFGGPGMGGSLRGTLEFRDGLDPNQSWVGSQHELMWINFSTDPVDPTAELLPGYRGMTCVALSRWEFGEDPRPDVVSFKVTADCQDETKGGYPMVNALDANPMAVLRALITHPWFGLGYDDALIDDASFTAAAITLNAENLGVSGVIDSRDAGLRWMSGIFEQIEAAFYKDRLTGLYKIKLIRDDYDPDTIPVLGPAQGVVAIEDIVFTTYQDTLNEVIVRYVNVQDAEAETATQPAQNTANISQNGNRIRSATRDYPWVSNQTTAARLAQRDLAALGTPLFVARVICSQDAYEYTPGQALKLVWPQQGWDDGVVIRVVEVNHGPIGDERIVLTVIQDRFGVDYAAMDGPIIQPAPGLRPWPVTEHVVEEMPFTLQTLAMFNQYILNNFTQHMMYLARRPLVDDTFQSIVVNPDGTTVGDMPEQTFCPTAVIEINYAYAIEPYDTTIGLRITSLSPPPGDPGGVPLVDGATYDDISRRGVNLIYAAGELMAFEGYTDLGGGVYRLDNVWRALGETIPVNHFAGSTVYFLNGDREWLDLGRHVGRLMFDSGLGEEFVAKLLPASDGLTLPAQRAHAIPFGPIRRRWRLPARVADLVANGAKALSITEEGFSLSWRARQWGRNRFVRGNDPSEFITSSTTTSMAVAEKIGVQAIGKTDLYDVGAAVNVVVQPFVPLGRIGHGTLLVGIETRDLDDDGTPIASWSWPFVVVVAPHWRNLLLNPAFGSATLFWTTIAGDVDTNFGSSGLGGSGSYVEDDATGGYTIEQVRDVGGYDPNGVALGLSLLVGCHLIGDGTDQFTLSARLLDAASGLLSATNLTETSPTVWTHKVAVVPYVAGVDKIAARLAADGGELVASSIRATRFEARVGQITASLLANGSFESGTTSWTVASGSFVTGLTTAPYDGTNYIRGGANATNELSQTVAVPAGYEGDATAVLNLGTTRDGSDADDTGEVILEALDGGSSVIATTTTGVYTPASNLVWESKQLALSLPTHTASVRTRLRALRVGDAGDANICFDGARLRIHKALDVAQQTYSIDSPTILPMPSIWEELIYAFPSFAWWRYVTATWGGDSTTSLLPSAPILADGGIEVGTRFVGRWDGATSVFPAWRFPGGVDSADLAASGSQFANVSSSGSWWAISWIRIDPRDWSGSARQLFGRRSSTRGWEVTVNSSGNPVATLYGSGATISVTSPVVVTDGRAHRVGVRHASGSPGTLTIIVDRTYTSAAETGMGQISTAPSELVWFRVGRSLAGSQGLRFQVQSLFFGRRSGSGPTDSDLNAMLPSHGPSQIDVTDSSPGAIVVPDAAGGVAVRRRDDSEAVVAWDPVVGRWALAISRSVTNLAPTQDFEDWFDDGGGGMVTTPGVEDVEGFPRGVRLVGTNSNRLTIVNVPTTTNTVVRATFFARRTPGAGSTQPIQVVLEDTSNNFCDSASVALTEVWQRVDLALDFTSGSVVDCNVAISPSSTGTSNSVEISGPVLLHQGDEHPIVLPHDGAASAGGMSYQIAVAPNADLPYAGQISMQLRAHNSIGSTGIVLDAQDGSTNHNRRFITMVGTELRFSLFNASGTGTTSEVTDPDVGGANYLTVESRWCRAGLIDAPTSFGGIRVDGVADYDVTSTFTVDAAAALIGPYIGDPAAPAAQPNVYIGEIALTDRERLF